MNISDIRLRSEFRKNDIVKLGVFKRDGKSRNLWAFTDKTMEDKMDSQGSKDLKSYLEDSDEESDDGV